MATGNFKTMDNFPLIIARDEYRKICPECGLSMDNEAEKCDECGYSLADVESQYDECLMQERVDEMESFAKRLTSEQLFFEVSVESGYYSGLQFYVKEKYCDVEEWSNDDAQYEFGLCRSKVIRMYRAAMNKVRRELRKTKKTMGLEEFAIRARFSNGETIYSKVA